MAQIIKIKRGVKSQLPVSNLSLGEPLFCTDTGELFIAITPSSSLPVVTDIPKLQSGSIAQSDLFEFYDVSETTGVRNKQITFTDLKYSLNIPSGSSDEKVAASNGSTAGYLIDVLSVSTGLLLVQSGSLLNISIDEIDGGTFI